MKKLTYLVSAVVAGLFTSAQAEVSVSGSGTVAYQSAGSDSNLHTGGAVSFGLSTTTASGMTVSTSAGISASVTSNNPFKYHDQDDADQTQTTPVATGFKNISFATGGATLTIGADIDLPDGVGEVGALVSDLAALNSNGITEQTGLTDDEGAGFSLSTSLGEAGLTFYYVADAALDGNGVGNVDGATGTGTGVKVSTAAGPVGLTLAYSSHSDTNIDDTETAASASYAMGSGTISAGYTQSTGAKDGTSFGVAYSMSLDADTALAIGYSSHDVNDKSGRATDVTLSRALGGGVSVFAEMRSTSGDTDSNTSASTMAIGSSVSF